MADESLFTGFHGTSTPSLRLEDLDPRHAVESEGTVFFTSNEDMAHSFTLPREYGETVWERPTGEFGESGEELYADIEPGPVLRASLRIRNPFRLRGEEAQQAIDDTTYQGEILRRARSGGFDGVVFEDVTEFADPGVRGDVYAVFNKGQIQPVQEPRPPEQSNLPAVLEAASAASQLLGPRDEPRSKGKLQGGIGALRKAPWFALARMAWNELSPDQRQVAEDYAKQAYGSLEAGIDAAQEWTGRQNFPEGFAGGVEWAKDALGFGDQEPSGIETIPQRVPKDLLIMPCGNTKDPTACAMTAAKRYVGPLWQSFNKALGGPEEVPKALREMGVDLHILSAEHGLIPADTLIENYDREMTPERIREMAGDKTLSQTIRDTVGSYDADRVHLATPKKYSQLVADVMGREYPTIYPSGTGQGSQRAVLTDFLKKKMLEAQSAERGMGRVPEGGIASIEMPGYFSAFHGTVAKEDFPATPEILEKKYLREEGESDRYGTGGFNLLLGPHFAAHEGISDKFAKGLYEWESIGGDTEFERGRVLPAEISTQLKKIPQGTLEKPFMIREPFEGPTQLITLDDERAISTDIYDVVFSDPKNKGLFLDLLRKHYVRIDPKSVQERVLVTEKTGAASQLYDALVEGREPPAAWQEYFKDIDEGATKGGFRRTPILEGPSPLGRVALQLFGQEAVLSTSKQRKEIVDEYRRILGEQGFVGIEYTNTARSEIEGLPRGASRQSYVVFDPFDPRSAIIEGKALGGFIDKPLYDQPRMIG